MSGITEAMTLLRTTFDKYAGKEGDKDTLTKAELADLLKSEGIAGGATSKAEVDEFFNMLDDDGDGVVDFQEYVTFVAALTMMCA